MFVFLNRKFILILFFHIKTHGKIYFALICITPSIKNADTIVNALKVIEKLIKSVTITRYNHLKIFFFKLAGQLKQIPCRWHTF